MTEDSRVTTIAGPPQRNRDLHTETELIIAEERARPGFGEGPAVKQLRTALEELPIEYYNAMLKLVIDAELEAYAEGMESAAKHVKGTETEERILIIADAVRCAKAMRGIDMPMPKKS